MRTSTAMIDDTRRLHPAQRLRALVRNNAHEDALALALQLDEPYIARRAAWSLIKLGAEWNVETEAGEALPLLGGASDGGDWLLDVDNELRARWLRVNGARVPMLWNEHVAHRFAVDVAEIVVERIIFKHDLALDAEQELRGGLELARSCSNGRITSEHTTTLSNRRAQRIRAMTHEVFTLCRECREGFTCSTCEPLVALSGAAWCVFCASTPERADFEVAHALVTLVDEDALDAEHDSRRDAFVSEVLVRPFLERTLLS